jgi:Lrp/AsnC family transcriptional regulator, leucine-responsive regulatory protein
MKITELDKKILFELDKDGKASLSEIARVLDTTPQVVKYHFEQLMERGIIKHFWAFVDYDKAGYSFFWGYWIKFSGLTKEKEEAMYTDFVANKYIPIIMRCDGYADVMLGIIGKDLFHHNEVLQEVFTKYAEYIATSDIVVGLGFVKFPRSYLIERKNEHGHFAQSGGTTEVVKLDETDRKILSILQIDGRKEFTEIAKILNVSVGMIHKRFRKLEKKGVISKFTYTPNYENLGINLYRVLFKIFQFEKKRMDDLYKFCQEHPNIVNYVKVMGNWQLMLDIEIDNRDKLRDLIREMKHEFKDIIYQIEINEVYKIEKFTQMAVEYPDILKNNKHEEVSFDDQ